MRTARHQPRRTSENGSYVVQANDTLWDISRAFSVSLNDLCAVNGLSKRSVIRPGQRLNLPGGAQPVRVTAPLTTSTYTVRKGDTLSDIANRSGTSVEELRNANGISGSRIHPGTELRIPDSKSATPSGRTASVGTTYRVRKGDTLYDIARRFGTSISALRRANGLRSSRIYPGDVLQIPPSEAKG
jgi:LysM repeat protein